MLYSFFVLCLCFLSCCSVCFVYVLYVGLFLLRSVNMCVLYCLWNSCWFLFFVATACGCNNALTRPSCLAVCFVLRCYECLFVLCADGILVVLIRDSFLFGYLCDLLLVRFVTLIVFRFLVWFFFYHYGARRNIRLCAQRSCYIRIL